MRALCRCSPLPAQCSDAPRAGQVISEKDKCPQCKGNKVVQDKKILEVNVERGMQHNQKIVFRGEADEAVRRIAAARASRHADAPRRA